MKTEERKKIIEPQNRRINITRQCELFGISRSAFYYQPRQTSKRDLELMRLIDEEYLRHPFYGTRRLCDYLQQLGYVAGRDKVRTLMQTMGIEAVYPKPRLSTQNKAHKKYSYLLKNLEIDASDIVWSSDITYIPIHRSFAYLTVVMDWYSRYILSWRLSSSLDADFCIDALEDALLVSTPTIFNSDQGCQFTCDDFISVLKAAHIWISMDGKGRAFDNIINERLWRSVKYEEVYLHEYADYMEAQVSLGKYIDFYNNERRHQSLERQTPVEVYFAGRKSGENAA